MDNIYQEGTTITAKARPETPLIIKRYLQRVYFCEVIGDPQHKMLAYFERELVTPMSHSK